MIAAQAGKINDIRFGHRTTRSQQAVARLQLFEVFAERMNAVFLHLRATYPLLADGGQHRRAALDCGALQIVFHCAQTTQLFTTACTPWAAVNQLRQRGAVAGGLFC
ncbi:hypothetical protein D3C76_1447510 [compost metagenome]